MRSTWVDFKVLKQLVSIEMAIAGYGLTLRRVHGPYLRGRRHGLRANPESLFVNGTASRHDAGKPIRAETLSRAFTAAVRTQNQPYLAHGIQLRTRVL